MFIKKLDLRSYVMIHLLNNNIVCINRIFCLQLRKEYAMNDGSNDFMNKVHGVIIVHATIQVHGVIVMQHKTGTQVNTRHMIMQVLHGCGALFHVLW